jgi:hypothetical protein
MLKPELRNVFDRYARDDLPGGVEKHIAFFSFLREDPDLMRRVGEEYFSARYLYKLWEALQIDEDWARRAQVQLQVQQYASIYEACIHHLLFQMNSEAPEVRALLTIKTLKKWSLSEARVALMEDLNDLGRPIVGAVVAELSQGEEKVRFDSKIYVAVKLGILSTELGKELIEFYQARNLIHIHAELKKSDWTWQLDFAKRAYWRLTKFKNEVELWQATSKAAID